MKALLVAAALCLPHEAAVKILSHEHHEVPVAIALDAADRVLEVFASPEGTWTITVTSPDGVSCIMGTGEGFESIEPERGQGT